ncbi:hypothetical protein [Candidatus Thiosymbion oneisti]|uniref:hypothetical protein n=1 Tax=Candidatus Thiosymbion oneisti TaxID=589554 RepID=UPI003C7DD32B
MVRAGFPFYDQVGSHQRLWIGYQGTRQTLFKLANILLSLKRRERSPLSLVPVPETGVAVKRQSGYIRCRWGLWKARYVCCARARGTRWVIYPLHVNISPRCTPLAPDSSVATRRNRAWLFLLVAPCSRVRSTHLAYRNIHVQRV